MGDAKEIEVRPIPRADADLLVKRVHYSGSVVQNSQVSLGVFLNGRLEGAMQFGPPLDRRKMLGIVAGSGWESVVELNRMAFGETLPRNSESRALGVAFRIFRKAAPQVKWVVSFADGCQCGDGAIYRASGFLLTGVKENDGLWRFPDGDVVQRMSLEPARPTPKQMELRRLSGLHTAPAARLAAHFGAVSIRGYMLRYIRFLDDTWRDRLTVPVIPFDQIPADARMYRGERRGGPVGHPGHPPGMGGLTPTPPLHRPPLVVDPDAD